MDNAILCVIDFTDASKDVVEYALNLSKNFNNHVTLLYTYRLNSLSGDVVDRRREIEELAKQNFLILEKEVLSGSGVSYDFKVEIGFISKRVKEFAKKNGVNFLVIGREMSMSSMESFDELAESLQVPLVVVP